MARFKFRLETVLSVRRREERQRQVDYFKELRALNDMKDRLKSLEAKAAEATEILRQEKLQGELDLAYLAAHRRYLLALGKEAAGVMGAINKQALVAQAAQEKLTAAAVARKAIETLRQKSFDRWQAAQNESEAKSLDDLGTQLAYQNLMDGLRTK